MKKSSPARLHAPGAAVKPGQGGPAFWAPAARQVATRLTVQAFDGLGFRAQGLGFRVLGLGLGLGSSACYNQTPCNLGSLSPQPRKPELWSRVAPSGNKIRHNRVNPQALQYFLQIRIPKPLRIRYWCCPGP